MKKIIKSFFFSVIIPAKNFNKHIKKNIKYLLREDHHNFEFEIIIVLNKIEKRYKIKNCKFISSGVVAPGRKRDLGSRNSKGKYLVFLDDDSYVCKNYLSHIHNFVSKNPKIKIIGGPGVTPKNQNLIGKVLGSIFESKILTSESNRYRIEKNNHGKLFDDWPSMNFIINKKIFNKVKGFNTDAWPGEDTILCNKLLKINKKVFYLPKLYVSHYRRDNIIDHLKQVGSYGKMRGFLFKKMDQNSFKLKFLLPSLFTLYLFILPILNLIFNNFFIYLLIYFYLMYIFIGTFLIIIKYKKLIYSISYPAVILTHIIYGIYFVLGFSLKQMPLARLR